MKKKADKRPIVRFFIVWFMLLMTLNVLMGPTMGVPFWPAFGIILILSVVYHFIVASWLGENQKKE